MQCDIQWQTNMTKKIWCDLLNQCPHTTLLQSYAYAQTMREVHFQTARHGIIFIDGKKAGIVQIQEVSLFKKAIHAMSLDRGPLWFDKFGTKNHQESFVAALNDQFPRRIGRKRRFLPEFIDENVEICTKNWKKDTKTKNYRSFIVNLDKNIEEIRENIHKRWERSLKKAEKHEIPIEIDGNLETLPDFLDGYMKDRMQKRYAGASAKFLASLSKYSAMNNECFILNALHGDEVIASILILMHGRGATYQAGWNSATGRDKNAHHLLFWRAIEILKTRNITHFDLGGHNDNTEGLRVFKEGLGGHEIALIGSYS